MLRKLLSVLRGWLRLLGEDADPDPGPRYGASVSYAPCPACGEGSLVYDEEAGTSRCNSCGHTAE